MGRHGAKTRIGIIFSEYCNCKCRGLDHDFGHGEGEMTLTGAFLISMWPLCESLPYGGLNDKENRLNRIDAVIIGFSAGRHFF